MCGGISLQMALFKRGIKEAFPQYKIYYEEALLEQRYNQPNTQFFNFCDIFINFLLCQLN